MLRICDESGDARLIGSAFQCVTTTASIDGKTKCTRKKAERKEIEMHEMTNIIRFTLTMSNPSAYGKEPKKKEEEKCEEGDAACPSSVRAVWVFNVHTPATTYR